MSTCVPSITESDDGSRRGTVDSHLEECSPTFLSTTESFSPRTPHSHAVVQHSTSPRDTRGPECRLEPCCTVDFFPCLQEMERKSALAPSLQASLARLPKVTCLSDFQKDVLIRHDEQISAAATDFQYMAPTMKSTHTNKRLMKNLTAVQQRKRNDSTKSVLNTSGGLGEMELPKAEFTSTTLRAIIPNTSKLEREYLFPRATSCISYSDERIRMRLANKANDERSTKPIMYANYDDVGMRSSSALAVLNPFKLAPESLLHPYDELALQPLKRAVRKSSSIKKHLFRSYLTAAAANLRNAVSEQGFYAKGKQVFCHANSPDQSVEGQQTYSYSNNIQSDHYIAQDDDESLRKKNEEMLYRLKYSHFILKIINTEEDCADEIMEDLNDLLHCTSATKSVKSQDSCLEGHNSGVTIKRITNDGIKYTVRYDADLTVPIVIKIIASHSILELLYASYKDKRDLVRIIRDYEEDQVAFRMGLLQATATSNTTAVTPSSVPCKHLSSQSQKFLTTEPSTSSMPSDYSRAFFSLINPSKSDNPKGEAVSEPEAPKRQSYNINMCIQRLNNELKKLEEKRQQRKSKEEAAEPQSYSMSDSGLSSFSLTLDFSPDRAGPGDDWRSPSMTTLISKRPIRTSIVEDKPIDSTHAMTLSLLDTFTTRKDMCKMILLKQSQRAPDDLLARASQLRDKLAQKRDIEAFNAEQKKKTSVDVRRSNEEVISYMLSSHHNSRRILAKEDLKPAIDKVGRQAVARDYFHGDAPSGAQTVTLDTDAIRKTLDAYVHKNKGPTKWCTFNPVKGVTREHISRHDATRASLAQPKAAPFPRSLNFKTDAVTQPAGPWKAMKVTKPDYYSK